MSAQAVPEFRVSLSSGQLRRLREAAARCASHDLSSDPGGFVNLAKEAVPCLPADLLACLRHFRRHGNPSGGLLIRGLPVFSVPETPSSPQLGTGTRLEAAGVLGMIAAALGEQIGYRPELGGQIIQDVVPVAGFENTQQSVSSTAELLTHVELAFADDAIRAAWILLSCLRADHDRVAGTTLSSVDDMMPLLDAGTVSVLQQPRFFTTVDQSWLRGLGQAGPITVGPIQVLTCGTGRPQLRVDFAETLGADRVAQAALERLRAAAEKTARVIRLVSGDLLAGENERVTHGRTPFAARFDGLDRWLLRASVVRSLTPSAYCRPGGGRVVEPALTRILAGPEAAP